jgi:glutathione S-transferase
VLVVETVVRIRSEFTPSTHQRRHKGAANMIDVYTDATPNGLKVSIGLEEMGLNYNVHRIWLGGEQLTPEFTALNPNNKIPVLVDDGLVVTESGAILLYLAEKSLRWFFSRWLHSGRCSGNFLCSAALGRTGHPTLATVISKKSAASMPC